MAKLWRKLKWLAFFWDTVYVCNMVWYHVIIVATLSRGLSLTDPISVLYQPCELRKPLQQPQQQQLLLPPLLQLLLLQHANITLLFGGLVVKA